MRKLLFTCLFFAGGLTSFGQATPDMASGFIPKITLPSPEAFSFTKYGDIPVGLFTGTMRYPIPLLQVQSGKIGIPVSLDYASNGIKVDEVSGRTGMGWTLQIGGVITRNIMGQADEWAAFYTPPNAADTSWDFFNYLKGAISTNGNTQPDEFTFSFMGYSGKFYKNYAGNIVQLTPNALQISTNSYFDDFTITTPDGNEYYFGPGAVDFTEHYDLYGGGDPFNSFDKGGRTAWYLTKIKNPYGDSVEFKYSVLDAPVEYLSGVSQTYKGYSFRGPSAYLMNRYLLSSNCAPGPGHVGYSNEDHPGCAETGGIFTNFSVTKMNCVKLDEVWFRQGKLKLYYSSRDDLPGEAKLDSLDLFSRHGNKRIRSIGFEYTYSQSSAYHLSGGLSNNNQSMQSNYPYLKKRLFLEKLKFFNADKSAHEQYKFDYADLNGLAPRLSFAQDYFGYFNGKENNEFYPNDTYLNVLMRIDSFGGNRSVDPAFAKKGMLSRITYPTGGYSEMEYASNDIPSLRRVYDTVSVTLNHTGTSTLEYSPIFSCDIPYKVRITAEWINPYDPNFPPVDTFVSFKLQNLNNSEYVFNYILVHPGQVYENYAEILNMVNSGNYRMSLESGNADIRCKAEFIHYDEVVDSLYHRPTSGVRVASVRNYSSDGVIASMKKFDYSDSNGRSSARLVNDFADRRDFAYMQRTNCGSEPGQYIGGNYVLSSSTYIGGTSNNEGNVNYEYVTEIFDSSGAGGSVKTRFAIAGNSFPSTFACAPPIYEPEHGPYLIQGAPYSNTGHMNGKELSKTVFARNGNQSRKIRESFNFYSIDNRLYHVDSFYVIRRPITRWGYFIGVKYFSDYDVNEYKRYSVWTHLDSTVEKEYDDFNNALKTKTMYAYGNEMHLLPTEIRQVNSKGDTLKNVTRYVGDYLQVDPGSVPLGNMVAKNIVQAPLEVKAYSNAALLSTTLTEYNASLLPQALKKSTAGFALELEAEYTKFDVLNHPVEFLVRGAKSALLIDTALSVLVAGCQGAAYDDIAYNSFETAYTGNWSVPSSSVNTTYFITGRQSYDLSNGSLSKSSLQSAKKYILSYWSRSGSYSLTGATVNSTSQGRTVNGWTYYEHLLTTTATTISLSGTGLIDEVRLHPQKAQMTTYTHEPFIGITSQCGPNGQIAYYEYDSFGRLRLIRDADRNVLKKICYNYAGQVENCN
jgi:hypothetical protein